MNLADYHVHPGYNIDALDISIDQYCNKGVELGLKEICFTPHFELDPVRKEIDWFVRINGQRVSMQSDWLDFYFKDIKGARKKYGHLLEIKAGVEVGYDLGLDKPISELLDQYPFDFVLGSIHCLDHIAISSKKESPNYYQGKNIDDICRQYFATLQSCVISGLFDCIGHFDIYRRHGGMFFGNELTEVERPYVQDILELMSQRGTGLEINTSGLRQGLGDFFPRHEILTMAVNAGIKVFTTGSDAHRLEDIGSGLLEADTFLMELGLEKVNFSGRKIVKK